MSLTGKASGPVLLAYRDAAERTRMGAAQIKAFGDSRVDPAELFRGLEEVRVSGRIVMPGRHARSVTDIARPVFGVDGKVVASVSAPHLERLEPAGSPSIHAAGQPMVDLAAQVSDRWAVGAASRWNSGVSRTLRSERSVLHHP